MSLSLRSDNNSSTGAIQVNGIDSLVLGSPTAGGTPDNLTVDLGDVNIGNGTRVLVRASAANSTTTPTLQVVGKPPITIVKGANQALVAGDIAGAGHWLEMNFDSTLDKWVLLNPYNVGLQTASSAETRAGTLTTKTVTPKGLADSMIGGVGQTWQDVTASRVRGTTYTNTTGRPIQILVQYQDDGSANKATFSIGALSRTTGDIPGGNPLPNYWFSAVIPNGETYSISGGVSLPAWWELR